MDYLQASIDYIFFFYGLSFVLLAAVCFFLSKEEAEMPAWSWLGLFGLTHGLNEWLDMLSFTFSDNSVFSAIRTAVMALSFVFLFEFGRRTLKKTGMNPPGAWIYAPLLLLGSAGYYYGFNGLNASARYALGLTGGLLSAWALYRAASGKKEGLRLPLLAISLGLSIYALASGGVTPGSALMPARWINYAAFSSFFGFPVQLLRALLALGLAISAWSYFLNLAAEEGGGKKKTKKSRLGWLAMGAVVASLSVGWVLTDSMGNKANTELTRDSQNTEKTLFNRLKDSMLETEHAVTSLAGSPLLPDALAAGGAVNLAAANSALDRYNESFELSVCYLLNLEGVTIASSNRNKPVSFVGKNYGFRPYFKEAVAGRPGHYFAIGVTTGERGYFASYPVRKNGKIVGVVVAKRNLDFLAEELRLFPYAFFVNPEGIIFLSSRRDLLYRVLWPVSIAAREELGTSKQFGALDFEPVLNAELQNDDILNFSGERFHVSRHYFRQQGWSLVALSSMRPVFMARFAGILLTFSLSMLLLAFFVALVQSEVGRETAENLLHLKEEVKTLSGILPICAGCKKIRDEQGDWDKVETYVAKHTEAKFSHGLCPDCVKRLYPEYADEEPGPPA